MANDSFELRANCQVLWVELDDAGAKAIGVTYVTAAGEEVFQPADLVIIGAFAFNNVRLMLLSGIGTPYTTRRPAPEPSAATTPTRR
jgi:gluconate 2-dehydrogenase alpha chain